MTSGTWQRLSANSRPRDPALADLPVVEATRPAELRLLLSNSFGFGGTNATLVLQRYNG